MKKLLSASLAGNIVLISLAALAVFHILVLVGIVPANIVWGGQAGTSPANLLVLEIIALIVTLFFALIITMKVGYINSGRFKKAVDIALWIVFAYLLLNTVGNLASGITLEKLIFTPLTLFLAFCVFRLTQEK